MSVDMSVSVPLFVVPDAGWGVGWQAGAVVPTFDT